MWPLTIASIFLSYKSIIASGILPQTLGSILPQVEYSRGSPLYAEHIANREMYDSPEAFADPNNG